MFRSSHLIPLLFLLHLNSVLSLPHQYNTKTRRSTATTPLSPEEIDAAFLRPALFTRTSYCSLASVTSFACGAQCDALGGGVEVLVTGGDDGLIPSYFVAYDTQTQSIVVVHRGTDPDNELSVLNDLQIGLVDLDPARVPNQPGGLKVHNGFQDAFERTADQILSTVQQGLSAKQVNKVLVTGHSLGGAIGLFDALMLKASLPADTQITTTVFGIPRVGNPEFASFVTATLGTSFSFVTNGRDPVPILPPTFFGYAHPAGEFHIITPGLQPGDVEQVVACDGAENQSCSAGTSLDDIQASDHTGPYIDGIGFGGSNCPA